MGERNDWSVYFYTLCFCLGNAFAFLVQVSFVTILLFCLVTLSAAMIHSVLGIENFRKAAIASIFFLVALLLVIWHQSATDPDPLGSLTGTEQTYTALVTEEPDERDFNTRLTVDLLDYDTRALITVAHYPRYHYGDLLSITGTMQQPSSFTGDTDRVFDYPNYLAKDGIRYVARYVDIERLDSGQGNAVKSTLLSIKAGFITQLHQILPEPHSSFLAGLLVGAKSSMGTDLLDDFRDTGIIHIVVLSGFNVTIVADAIMRILSYFGLAISATFGAIGILFFAIMTGASSTIIRASLMAFLVLVARVTGNHARVLRMLCIAGILMLLVNPMLLLYDPGFQLSFLATIGLIALTPFVERFLLFIPKRIADLRGLAAATIATQIMVMPLLLYSMGTLPVYAPFVNLLVLAGVPWVMGTGFLAGMLSFVSPIIALPITFITWLILEYFLQVVQFFLALPFAVFSLPPFSVWWVVLAYTAYLLVTIFFILRHKNN